MSFGSVVQVYEEIAGSELAADAALAATSITAVDPTDFSPDGGTIFVDGATPETIDYLTVDDDTGIVTLAAGLAAAHLTGDALTIQPQSIVRVAEVLLEDQEESMLARVAHSLYDRLPVGLRDDTTGETELVELGRDDANLLVVADVVDREPNVDGSFIDTATLPPTSTDGLPPAVSPAALLQPGIGSLFVNWTPIANADAVEYEVHISTTSGFTPGPTTLAATTGASQAVIRAMPDGTPLDYSTAYFVRIKATDADGSAAAGTQASSTPVQVTGPDIAAATITGDNILGNTITAAEIASVLAVLGVIETADSGQRVVIDSEGLHLFAADGSTLVDLPTDALKNASFSGELDAVALSVSGLAQFLSEAQVLPNGQIHLVGGQPDPSLSPGISSSYPVAFNFDYNIDARSVTGSRITHYSATGGSGGTTPCYYGTIDTLGTGGTHYVYAVEWLASNGHVNRAFLLDKGVTVPPVGFGACLVGSTIVALNLSSATGILVLQNIDRASFSLISNVSTIQPGTTNLDATNAHVIGYGCDGTNPYIFSYNGTTKLPNRTRLTMSGGVATGGFTTTSFSSSAVKLFSPGDANNLGDPGGPTNVLGAAWDGTNWLVSYSWGNSGGALTGRLVQMYVQATSAIVAKQEIFLPFSVGFFGGGITYDGTDYYMAGGSATTTNRRLKGTVALTWDYTLGRTLYAAYTWSNGTVHTGISPVAQLSMESGISQAPLMRQTVILTMPAIPALATQNLLYALFANSTPSAATLKLQSAATHASTNTLPTVTFLTWDAAGATPTSSTYTSGGSPAAIRGDGSGVTASWRADSAGVFRLPVATQTQRDTVAVTKGDVVFNDTTKQVDVFDGTIHKSLGPELNQQTLSIPSTAGGGTSTLTVSIAGLNVGDVVMWAGISAGSAFAFYTDPVVTVAGQITLRYHNTDDGTAHALASQTHSFLIFRRS